MGRRRDATLLEDTKGLAQIDLELLELLGDAETRKVPEDRLMCYADLCDAGLVGIYSDAEVHAVLIERDGLRLLELMGRAET